MSLRLTTSRVEPNIVVLHLVGTMAIGTETDGLESLVHDLLRQSDRRLIFDLADVDQIDAEAILFMVRSFFTVLGSGGELRFAEARPEVARPFKTTMLDTLLPFYRESLTHKSVRAKQEVFPADLAHWSCSFVAASGLLSSTPGEGFWS